MLELITGWTTAETEATVRGTLDELAREGARRMIEVALQLERIQPAPLRCGARRLIKPHETRSTAALLDLVDLAPSHRLAPGRASLAEAGRGSRIRGAAGKG